MPRLHRRAEGVLVKRLDNTVAFLTNDNIRMMSRISTPRPLPPLKPIISKALTRQPSLVRQPSVNPNPSVNPKPLVSQPSLVRQPSINHLTPGPPSVKNPYHTGPPPGPPPVKGQNHTGPPPGAPPPKPSPKYTPKVGEKRNISSQELKQIIDSIKKIRNKIRYDDLTCENKIDYQIQLMKLSIKLS